MIKNKVAMLIPILIIIQQALSKVKTPTESIYSAMLILMVVVYAEREKSHKVYVDYLEKNENFTKKNMEFFREQWLEEKNKNKKMIAGK